VGVDVGSNIPTIGWKKYCESAPYVSKYQRILDPVMGQSQLVR